MEPPCRADQESVAEFATATSSIRPQSRTWFNKLAAVAFLLVPLILLAGCAIGNDEEASVTSNLAGSNDEPTVSTTVARQTSCDYVSLTPDEQRALRNLQWRMYWIMDAYNHFDDAANERLVNGTYTEADKRQARRMSTLIDLTLAEYKGEPSHFTSTSALYEQWIDYLHTRSGTLGQLVETLDTDSESMVILAYTRDLEAMSSITSFAEALYACEVPKVNAPLVDSPLTESEEVYLMDFLTAFAGCEPHTMACQAIAEERESYSDVAVSEALSAVNDMEQTVLSTVESPSYRFDYLHDRLLGALRYARLGIESLERSQELTDVKEVDQAAVMFRLSGIDSQLASYLYQQLEPTAG